MSQTLSQKQLEEMYNGKPAEPYVSFFRKAILDAAASEQEGHRVYRTVLYVKVRAPSTVDWTAYRAQKSDIEQYAQEYQAFLESEEKKTETAPGIEIIPNLDLAARQELIDMGYSNITQLAAATNIPYHLDFARQSAVAINQVLQEQDNGEEESVQETSSEETRDVFEEDRRINAHDVGQRELPTRDEGRRENDSERVHESRPADGGQGLSINTFNGETFRHTFRIL